MADSLQVKLGADTSEFRGQLAGAVQSSTQSFNQIGHSGENAATRFGNAFEHRLFGMRHLSGAVATAIGLNFEKIGEGLARFFTGFSEEYEHALKKSEEASARAADANISYMHSLLGEEQKYLLALRERDAALKRIQENAPRQTGADEGATFLQKARNIAAVMAVLSGNVTAGAWGKRIIETHAAEESLKKKNALDSEAATVAEKSQQIHEHDLKTIARRVELEKVSLGFGLETLTADGRLREINSYIAEVKEKIAKGDAAKNQDEDLYVQLQALEKQRLTEIAAINKSSTLDAAQRHEVALLEAKGTERLSESEGVRYEVIKKIGEEKANQGEIEQLLAIPIAHRTEAEKERLRYLQMHAKELAAQRAEIEKIVPRAEQLFGLQSGALTAVTDQAGVERLVSSEKVKQLHALEEQNAQTGKANLLLTDQLIIMGKIYGASRDPNQIEGASDASLQDLIKKNKAEIAKVMASAGTGATALTDTATGNLIPGSVAARLQTDVDRAQFQLDQRAKLRSDFASGGEAQARQNFGGDSLQFEALLRQANVNQDNTKQLDYIGRGIESINKRLHVAGWSTIGTPGLGSY